MKLCLHRQTPAGTMTVEAEVPGGTDPEADARRTMRAILRAMEAAVSTLPEQPEPAARGGSKPKDDEDEEPRALPAAVTPGALLVDYAKDRGQVPELMVFQSRSCYPRRINTWSTDMIADAIEFLQRLKPDGRP